MEEISMGDALNLAVEKHKEGKLDEAEIIYKNILSKNPDNPDALHLLGLTAHQTNKHEEAIRLITKAIQLSPNSSIFYGNLGMVYDSLGKEEESAISYEKALEIDPKYGNAYLAHYNLGIFYKGRGELAKSLQHYEKAIELNNNFTEAHWNKSLILLLLGKFEEGWKEYDYRFKKESPVDKRKFDKPRWDGSPLDGKKILLVSEQGFGDNIQFVRYAKLAKERGGHVILECKKDLKKLFENLHGVDEIVGKNDSISNIDFDCYAHIMSLPAIFNTDVSTIPNKIPYLKADPALVEKFKTKIYTYNFKVGINWAGNPKQDDDKDRSITFEKLKFLGDIEGIKIFSLQKGEAAEQLEGSKVINLKNDINNFADTAAIMENLDLIITTDTSVAHLAGALGKPVWVLLKNIPDWRWLLDRKDSPWYSSMRLFRQEKRGDWDPVLNEVEKELRNLLNKP